MSGLDPRARRRLAVIDDFLQKVQHVHGLVEQFAAARDAGEQLTPSMKRAFNRLKREFTGAGLDTLAQQCGGLEIAAGRGGSMRFKTRVLREGVGSMRSQLEVEQRVLTTAARNDDEGKAD